MPEHSAADHAGQPALAQFARFLAAGGTAALMNFGSRFLFSEFMSFGYAVVCAFCVGLASGFLLSRFFVFDASRHGLVHELTLYVGVNLVALAQTWLLSVYLAVALEPELGVAGAEALAHLGGIMLPVVTSYFGHKYLTFRA